MRSLFIALGLLGILYACDLLPTSSSEPTPGPGAADEGTRPDTPPNPGDDEAQAPPAPDPDTEEEDIPDQGELAVAEDFAQEVTKEITPDNYKSALDRLEEDLADDE
ncbi:MAG: hypothetical protein OXU20_22450 [Myxococcales bacterium]|nr:hypothetical protein [Myxococcales bacterium]